MGRYSKFLAVFFILSEHFKVFCFWRCHEEFWPEQSVAPLFLELWWNIFSCSLWDVRRTHGPREWRIYRRPGAGVECAGGPALLRQEEREAQLPRTAVPCCGGLGGRTGGEIVHKGETGYYKDILFEIFYSNIKYRIFD